MRGSELGDLVAFVAVAEERSFTRAAAKLGLSQSALSYTVRRLETRLGVRLLNRTTRSVAPTEGGERLLRTLRPAFDQIDTELSALGELRDKPAGAVRITANDHAADTIGPDLRMAVVGAPSYFASRPEPKSPQDLVHHDCITFRQPSAGGIYAWEFEKRGREMRVRVDGQLVFNRMPPMLDAARAGFGLACLLEDTVDADVADGRLIRVLADWCPPFSGYHLYYPSRRQPSPAFVLLVNALRSRADPGTRPTRPRRAR